MEEELAKEAKNASTGNRKQDVPPEPNQMNFQGQQFGLDPNTMNPVQLNQFQQPEIQQPPTMINVNNMDMNTMNMDMNTMNTMNMDTKNMNMNLNTMKNTNASNMGLNLPPQDIKQNTMHAPAVEGARKAVAPPGYMMVSVKDMEQRQRLVDRLLKELDTRTDAVKRVGADLVKLRDNNTVLETQVLSLQRQLRDKDAKTEYLLNLGDIELLNRDELQRRYDILFMQRYFLFLFSFHSLEIISR